MASMGFREHLQDVCDGVDGAVACSLMGVDGIEVDTHLAAPGDVDVKSLLVEYTSVLRSAREAAEVHQAGGVSEFAVGTDKLLAVARIVSPEYFMVVALRPEGNYGKARYLLRITAPKVKSEL
jgi:predicted regulator of Ras-like GTPase activity (Roadblock/LC7/MglB family)